MTKKVVVVGGGPVGLETALAAFEAGYQVELFESTTIGGNLEAWGFVQMFSPWGMNISGRARTALALQVDEHVCPTGQDMVDLALKPLAELLRAWGVGIREKTKVIAIGRGAHLKKEALGEERRGQVFRILVEREGIERVVEADIVVDCSGSYSEPLFCGLGGLPAPGERGAFAAGRIDYHLVDIEGRARRRLDGKRVLVIGGGYSAATAVLALHRLAETGTEVVWLLRKKGKPFEEDSDDPLPLRRTLVERANLLACGEEGAVSMVIGGVSAIAQRDGRLEVRVDDGGSSAPIVVDHILAHVGYRPDDSIYRELQVHSCWATDGPMKTAAALMGSSGDCLSQSSAGPDALLNPEPDFYILGAKSYGRNSAFLLRLGHDQVDDLMYHLGSRAESETATA